MSSLENCTRALALAGSGTISDTSGIPACVDPQIDRPAADTDGHPVAALCDSNRLVLRQLRTSEDLVSRHEHGILPREVNPDWIKSCRPSVALIVPSGESWMQSVAYRTPSRAVTSDCLVQSLQEPRRIRRERCRQDRELVGLERFFGSRR